jgi:hypothetical protein
MDTASVQVEAGSGGLSNAFSERGVVLIPLH